MGYFFDDKGNILEELLDQKAKKTAESFITRDRKNPEKIIHKETLTSAQLRRFFGEFRQLEKKVKTAKDFKTVKPLIKMVKSKASYAANPSNQKIPKTFKNFLTDCINQIETREDFNAFMLHFEAVVGYYYGMGVSNN